jgi:molybdopterin synthase catalytic subunit
MFELTYDEIDVAAVEQAAQSPACGGSVVFVGRVRQVSRGKSVRYLEYDAYPEMAVAKMREIAAAIQDRWGTDRVAIVHRLGRLEIGEATIAIGVAAPHRAEAFEACRYAIDRLKEEVPIWKKEVTTDGEEWIGQGS